MARARQRLIKNAMTEDGESLTREQQSTSNNNRARSTSAPAQTNPALHSI